MQWYCTTDTFNTLSKIVTGNAQGSMLLHDIRQSQNKILAVQPYPKVTPTLPTIPPSLYHSNTIITPIYTQSISYIHITILYCVLMSSLMFVVLIFQCAKAFSFILIIVVDERNYESLLEFYTTCLMVACLPLARVKISQKFIGLARNIYRKGIVTDF